MKLNFKSVLLFILLCILSLFFSCATTSKGLITLTQVQLTKTENLSTEDSQCFKTFVNETIPNGTWETNTYTLNEPFLCNGEEISYYGTIKNGVLTIDCSKYGIIEKAKLEFEQSIAETENFNTVINHRKITVPFGGDWDSTNTELIFWYPCLYKLTDKTYTEIGTIQNHILTIKVE